MAGDEGDDSSDLVNEERDLDNSDHPEDFDLEEELKAELEFDLVDEVDPAVPE